MTDAGTRPRSCTVNPVSRAHDRTSALLAVPAERAAVPLRGLFTAVAATAAPVRGFLADDLPEPLGRPVGPAESGPPSETTSVTPYKAPTTRIASARGSLESTVSFKELFLFRRIAMARPGPPRGPRVMYKTTRNPPPVPSGRDETAAWSFAHAVA